MEIQKTRGILIAILIAALIIGIGLAIGLALGLRDKKDCDTNNNSNSNSNSPHTSKFKSASGTYQYAAVATDAGICSNIGRDILARSGGNAVDAAVAAAFCVGVVNSHSTGLGGGGFFTVYDKTQGWFSIIHREVAAAAATEDMFVAPENRGKSLLGALAICVPGEVMGLWEVHRRFGRVPWKTLVKPVITLCKEGVPLSKSAHHAAEVRLRTLANKTNWELYFDDNQNIKPVGSLIQMPKLARTLEIIAEDPMSFYNGSLAEDIVKDIKERGGIIELDDLKNYTVQVTKPTELDLPGNLKVFSTPPPGSGPVLSYMLNILSGYHMTAANVGTDDAKILTYHRMVEAMKFAFAKRTLFADARFVDTTELVKNLTSLAFGQSTRMKITDSKVHDVNYYEPHFYVDDDHGTSHLSVMDGEGNAVSLTGTINTYFGSKIKGSRTGIIFNNEMDDFSSPNLTNTFGVPPSEANFIRPGKRPMSSMCPAIVWDDTLKQVSLVVGASGGTRITTAIAQILMDVLVLNMSLPQAIDTIRMHHQLLPNEIQIVRDLPQVIKAGLEAKGHRFAKKTSISVVQGVHRKDGSIVAVSDYRKGGKPAGF